MRSLKSRFLGYVAAAAALMSPALSFAQATEPPINFADLADVGLSPALIVSGILLPALALFAAWVGFRYVMKAFRGAK